MATLDVIATEDFTGQSLLNIDSIVFGNAEGNANATFSSSQFGTSKISNAVSVTGSGGNNIITVNLAAAGTFSAASWKLSDWSDGDQVSIFGTSDDDTLVGTDFDDTLGGLLPAQGGGKDILLAAGGNDVLRLSIGFDDGSVFDGGIGLDELLLTTAITYDFRNSTILDVERLKFVQTATAKFVGEQIGGTTIVQIGGTLSEKNAIEVFGNAIDLSALTFTDWGRTDQTIKLFGSSATTNALVGSREVDTITGGALSDVIEGGGKADVLKGGDGKDFFVYRSGADLTAATKEIVDGGLSTDTIRLIGTGAIDFRQATISGIETVDFLSGVSSARFTSNQLGIIQQVSGSTLLDEIAVDASGFSPTDLSKIGFSSWTSGKDVIRINGTIQAQSITGTSQADIIKGLGGGDTLDGKAGADTLDGGGGDDTLIVDNAGDIIVEGFGGGTDTVRASVTFDLVTGVEVEFLSTTDAAVTDAINLFGNQFKQTTTGNAGANTISDGGKGAGDVLIGLAGNDTYRVFDAATVITEGAGQGTADTVVAAISYTLNAGAQVEFMKTSDAASTSGLSLFGNEFNQTITGNAGANSLRGNDGDDVVNGGDGDDRISGGRGNDTLAGNVGADTYFFSFALNAATNVDVIKGFSGIDLIQLSAAIFTEAGPAGALAASAFTANEFGVAQDATDRIIYETDTGRVRYDPDGTGAQAAVIFARMDGLPAMNAADFVIA